MRRDLKASLFSSVAAACCLAAGNPTLQAGQPVASVWHVVSQVERPAGQTLPLGAIPARAAAVLRAIREADRTQLAVSEEDGRLLFALAAATRAQRGLEIGTASGYSAIWIGLGLQETGGRLVSIESDAARAREATENIRRAGLAHIVRVIHGDAFAVIPSLEGSFDWVFLDAWKKDYRRFFDLVFPRLEPGGLLLAHNVVNKRNEMGDFLSAILDSPQVLTSIVMPSGEGISITYKRR